MKTERKLFHISLLDTFLYFVLLFVSINAVIYLISLFTGNPRFLFREGSWISQILFPVLYAIIQNVINRNGILKISDYKDVEVIKKRVDIISDKFKLEKYTTESDYLLYRKKTKIARFFGYFAGENMKVKYTEDEIRILAKRILLIQMENLLKKSTSIN